MKNFSTLLSAAIILTLSSCGMNNNTAKNSTSAVNSSATAATDPKAEKGLFAKMSVKDTIKAGELV